ncbi:MarR family transcriptional regulator [Nocardia sp. NBC_00508]|uniref:GbsR/MarR family transcriptional regulator n=1 Tax=Nocardia sp. NBC_00508 TaxID=2975992 RepID=UPI002E803141|nr:MarR family transcriptional regulator [Nocardia sp. NBC_00508]WUD65926.1 MarR family transcriptional regulator [Nocardia sp. NBC_00508]
MQRSTARALTALLYTVQDTMTAADLCAELSISSGAVSTAIKHLMPVGLIERVPAPGSRRDHYQFRAGAWAALMSQQNTMLAGMRDSAQEGIVATGPDTVAARRLHEMQDFYTFMLNELVPLIDRWRERNAAEHP